MNKIIMILQKNKKYKEGDIQRLMGEVATNIGY